MSDFFRLKIGAKRQITMPQLLLDRLLLKEGDELEFEVADAKVQAVRALKLVPVEYFDKQTLSVLKQRAAAIDRAGEVDRAAEMYRLSEEPSATRVQAGAKSLVSSEEDGEDDIKTA